MATNVPGIPTTGQNPDPGLTAAQRAIIASQSQYMPAAPVAPAVIVPPAPVTPPVPNMSVGMLGRGPAAVSPVAPAAAPAVPTPAPAAPPVGVSAPLPGAGAVPNQPIQPPLPTQPIGGLSTATPVGANALPQITLPQPYTGYQAPASGGASAAPALPDPMLGDADPVEIIRGNQISTRGGQPSAAAQALATMPGGLANPTAAVDYGFQQQRTAAQGFINQAMDYINGGDNIFERATRARAITGVYNATLGPNNQGSAETSGVDALNNALAGIQQAGIGANASITDAQLAGQYGLARTNATNQTAREQPVQISQDSFTDKNGLTHTRNVYGVPTYDSTNRVAGFTPISQQPATMGMVLPNGRPTLEQFATAQRSSAAGANATDAEIRRAYNKYYPQGN